MKRVVLALFACLALAGCAAADVPEPQPPSSSPSLAPIPDDGVLLSELGFRYAPDGVSVPMGAVMTERVDQVNNVTIVFTAPGGVELAGYLRRSLPDQGFEITADGSNSMLFERGEWQGAFTTEAGYSGLSFRTDREASE